MDAIIETIIQLFVLPNRRDRLRSKGLGTLSGIDDLHRFLYHSHSVETTSNELIRATLKSIKVDPRGLVLARWDQCDETQATPATLPHEGIVAFDAGRVMYVKWEIGASLFLSPPSRLAAARALVRDSR